MGSRKVDPENLVPRVFPRGATPPSREAEGGTGDVSRSSGRRSFRRCCGRPGVRFGTTGARAVQCSIREY